MVVWKEEKGRGRKGEDAKPKAPAGGGEKAPSL